MDSIPPELLKNGSEATTKDLTVICQTMCGTSKWPKIWTQACHTFTEETQLQAILDLSYHQPNQPSLENHAPSYPQRLKIKAEEMLAKEQAGFRPDMTPGEQIFFHNRVIIERHLQYQRDLLHNFVDFKTLFESVWHAGLWQVLRSFNIEEEQV